jgi:hypothetical protein
VGLRDAVEAFVEGRFQRTHLRSPRPVAQLLLLPPLPRLSLRGAGGLVLPLRKGRVARCGACCWTAADGSAARIATFQGDKAMQELVVKDELLLASLAPVVVEAARRAILLGPSAGLVRALLWPPGGRRRVGALLWPCQGCWWLSGEDGGQTRRRRWRAPLRLPRKGVEHAAWVCNGGWLAWPGLGARGGEGDFNSEADSHFCDNLSALRSRPLGRPPRCRRASAEASCSFALVAFLLPKPCLRCLTLVS